MKRHHSGIFLILWTTTLYTEAQLESDLSFPRATSLDTKRQLLFTSNLSIDPPQKELQTKINKLTFTS